MSAKPGRKAARRDVPLQDAAGDGRAPGDAAAVPAWIDSTDPRRRQIARFLLAGIWVYVAALWLLALDQTFDWGVF